MKSRKFRIFTVVICLIVSFFLVSEANAFPPLQVVASVPQENISLLAAKQDSFFRDFVLKVNNITNTYPDWKNVTNPTYAPKLFFDDINKDGKKEITIVLTTGYGSGVLQQQVHVLEEKTFHDGKTPREFYDEVMVDNPLAIVLKSVHTKLSARSAEIAIDGKKTTVDIQELQISPQNLFSDISFGNLVKFEVSDHHLSATVGAQVSPAAFIGVIKITYERMGKLYQARRIEFIPK